MFVSDREATLLEHVWEWKKLHLVKIMVDCPNFLADYVILCVFLVMEWLEWFTFKQLNDQENVVVLFVFDFLSKKWCKDFFKNPRVFVRKSLKDLENNRNLCGKWSQLHVMHLEACLVGFLVALAQEEDVEDSPRIRGIGIDNLGFNPEWLWQN